MGSTGLFPGSLSSSRWPCAPTSLLNSAKSCPIPGEDVHRIGKKLKAKGHPVGIQLSHCEDANHILRGIIWSWGGRRWRKTARPWLSTPKRPLRPTSLSRRCTDTMEAEVLGLGRSHNNVCLNSGKCGIILNPISAYISARKDKALARDGAADSSGHQPAVPPKGPRAAICQGPPPTLASGNSRPEGCRQGVPGLSLQQGELRKAPDSQRGL